MTFTVRKFVVAGLATALAACSAAEGDAGADGGADAAAMAEAEAPAAPGVEERAAIIARFRDAAESHCPFYKEAGGSTDDGEFAGSTLTLCSGRFSQTENFGFAMMNEDGREHPAGTLFLTMGANSAPGAFAPLYDVIFELAAVEPGPEQEQLRGEIKRWIYATPNAFTPGWEPVMTTNSGVAISAAGNKMQQGMLSLKIDPPR
ncbi:hypothetical protein [Pelagerythrobacter marensis]|uniref:Lipoprotein n=1 Tax=Pelagerythrobacter marensis TaxID=543877 RepID=A0A0G3X615_9SPHN|nr:hypothetical protein [Pelagerythrobacter marensis]AKM06637.1 hypothetical protein AM2010_550 [Pelagerythrobacter marensis]